MSLNLRFAWNCIIFSLVTLPLFPVFAGIGLVISLIIIFKQKYREIIANKFNWGLAILAIWLIVTSCFAVRPGDAFLGLANFLPFLALLASFPTLFQKPSQLRQIAASIAIPSLIVVILGIGQLFLGWQIPKLFFGLELVANGNPPGRMSSVLMYANILALYLSIAFILTMGLWIDTYRRLKRLDKQEDTEIARCGDGKNTSWRRKEKERKTREKRKSVLWFLSIVIIADSVGLILTSSRNAWAIAFFAFMAFAVYLGWRWLVLLVSLGISQVLIASFGPSPIKELSRKIVPEYFWARLSDEMYPDRPIATLRSTQWQFSLNLTQQDPLTGWGLRSFTPLYEEKMGIWMGHPHNLYLMLSAEIGIFGILLFFGLIAWIFLRAIILLNVRSQAKIKKQRDRLILFTYLVAFSSCIFFNIFDVSIFDWRVNVLGWILLAAILGVCDRYYNYSSGNKIESEFRESIKTK
ncbi:MAG: O-antigen ligase family protein [Prochloraceae cyanobacterium]